MAELGEVRARVTADTNQFRAAMAGASASMKQIRADVRAATADFRAGKISQRDYATAVRFAQTQVRDLRKEQVLLTGAGLGAAKGIGTVRSSLASLAAMTLGVKGTLGTFTSALLFMSVGNLTAIGVIAGIMALAKAFELLRAKASAAREEIKKVIERGLAFRESAAGFERAGLLEGIRVGESEQRRLNRDLQLILRAGKGDHVQARRLGEELGRVNANLIGYRDALAKLDQKQAEEAQRLREQAFAANTAADAYERARTRLNAMRADLATFGMRFGFGRPLDVMGYGNYPRGGLGLAPPTENKPIIVRGGISERLPEALNLKQTMKEAGEEGGITFVRGFISALRGDRFNIASLFRHVFAQILEDVVVTAIRAAIARAATKKIITAVAGGIPFLPFFAEGGVVPGPRGQPQLAVVHGGETVMPTQHAGVFTVAVPRLMGPALINDAEWQRIWRDTALAAEQQGFRMRVV